MMTGTGALGSGYYGVIVHQNVAGNVIGGTGATADSRRVGTGTRLYQQTWENPRLDAPIRFL